MRIVHLASTHRPFDARIFVRECVALSGAGHDVRLVVPHERDEDVHGVKIRAVEVPDTGTQRLTRTGWSIFQLALREPKDSVFHVHDAELLPYALALTLLGRGVIYDAHEDTPRQVLTQHWIPRPLRPIVSLFYSTIEAFVAAFALHIFAATPEIAARYPEHKTTLLRNVPSQAEFGAADPSAEPGEAEGRPRRVVYAGGISEIRGIFELLEAVDRVPRELGVRLALAGTFYPSDLEARVRRHVGWERVEYHGWVDRPALIRLLKRSAVGYCVLHATPQHVVSYPNKLFEYMAAGLPVVASDFPAWREIVDEAGCGLLVDPLDPAEIAGAIEELLRDPERARALGENGRRAFEARYTWEQEASKLLEVYDRLALGTPATSGFSGSPGASGHEGIGETPEASDNP